jgi:hypothetical protein
LLGTLELILNALSPTRKTFLLGAFSDPPNSPRILSYLYDPFEKEISQPFETYSLLLVKD